MPKTPSPLSNITILIVDDTLENLQLLAQILRETGYQVRPASNGDIALRSVAAKPPDLILLDVKMPDMDGYEVCRRLKAQDFSKKIPVIFISALNELDSRVKGFNVGGVDFIAKPFDAADVLARVKIHLDLQIMKKQLEQQNEQLQKEIIERKKVEKELERSIDIINQDLALASVVQKQLLPVQLPEFPGIRFTSRYVPTEKIGGDFFDVIVLDENRIAALLFDVSGHGIAAALVTVIGKYSFIQHLKSFSDPISVMEAVNRDIYFNTPTQMYLTALMMIIDVSAREVEYINAGHLPPVFYRSSKQSTIELEDHDLVLGFLEDTTYTSKKFQIAEGDKLFLFTDGLTETKNEQGEFFGEEKIEDIVISNKSKSCDIIVSEVMAQNSEFLGNQIRSDDICMLAIDFL